MGESKGPGPLPLEAHLLDPNPLRQLAAWVKEAEAADGEMGTAMILATVDHRGAPDARVVLLKGSDDESLVFFGHYESAKGRQLAGSPRAAAVFHWPRFARQVRVAGAVSRVSAAESDAYFTTRPRGSQIGAWASPQSQIIESRAELEARVRAVEQRFDDQPILRPAAWGGWRLVAERVELWGGRPDRLHDRLLYTRGPDGAWRAQRLAP